MRRILKTLVIATLLAVLCFAANSGAGGVTDRNQDEEAAFAKARKRKAHEEWILNLRRQRAARDSVAEAAASQDKNKDSTGDEESKSDTLGKTGSGSSTAAAEDTHSSRKAENYDDEAASARLAWLQVSLDQAKERRAAIGRDIGRLRRDLANAKAGSVRASPTTWLQSVGSTGEALHWVLDVLRWAPAAESYHSGHSYSAEALGIAASSSQKDSGKDWGRSLRGWFGGGGTAAGSDSDLTAIVWEPTAVDKFPPHRSLLEMVWLLPDAVLRWARPRTAEDRFAVDGGDADGACVDTTYARVQRSLFWSSATTVPINVVGSGSRCGEASHESVLEQASPAPTQEEVETDDLLRLAGLDDGLSGAYHDAEAPSGVSNRPTTATARALLVPDSTLLEVSRPFVVSATLGDVFLTVFPAALLVFLIFLVHYGSHRPDTSALDDAAEILDRAREAASAVAATNATSETDDAVSAFEGNAHSPTSPMSPSSLGNTQTSEASSTRSGGEPLATARAFGETSPLFDAAAGADGKPNSSGRSSLLARTSESSPSSVALAQRHASPPAPQSHHSRSPSAVAADAAAHDDIQCAVTSLLREDDEAFARRLLRGHMAIYCMVVACLVYVTGAVHYVYCNSPLKGVVDSVCGVDSFLVAIAAVVWVSHASLRALWRGINPTVDALFRGDYMYNDEDN